MSELHHECGCVAIYHLESDVPSPLCPDQGPEAVSRLVPRMLLDVQNRGQLSAGITTYNPGRNQLIDTHKDVGTVNEVFRMNHRAKFESLMRQYAGRAAIGHVRYATCGADDRSYAQPFERHHIQKHKWFSFGFNGQLANYAQLKKEFLADPDNYLARETDTELIMHAISQEYSGDAAPTLAEMMHTVDRRIDGAYSLVYLNALGDMLVARDPLGIKPMCYAKEGPLFAAASESVALLNLGFSSSSITPLLPGQCVAISGGKFEVRTFAASPGRAHCFFEWIYFSNVASTLDGQSVYVSRTRLGEELARMEDVPIDDDTIVVPVPDTSKAAADAMAHRLGVPSREGLIRNRYTGRTFIEGDNSRRHKAEIKYTPLREVLAGKRVLLVEDSIVRSTTMRVLLKRIREIGGAAEIHVRVACPPIIAPCFYGIDMSTVDELFAPNFLSAAGDPIYRRGGGPAPYSLSEAVQQDMAEALGADSLRYLPVEAIAHAVGIDDRELCQACITGEYPTPCGQQLYQLALENSKKSGGNGETVRTYEREQVFAG